MSEENIAPEEEVNHVTEADEGNEVENDAAEASPSEDTAELADSEEESATSETSEEDAKPQRKRNRISAKDRIAQLTARVKELEAQKPNPDDYEDGEYSPEYRQKEIEYAVEQALKQREQQTYQQQVTEKFNASLHEAAKSYGEDTVADAFEYVGTRITEELANAIKESGKGGEIVVHLAEHTDELAELSSMTPYAAAVRIGQLTAKMGKPTARKVTGAPPPPSTVGSNNTTAPDIDDENLSVAEYEARYRKKHGSIYG